MEPDYRAHNCAVQSILTLRSAFRSPAAAFFACTGLAVAAPFAYIPDASNNVTVVDLGNRMVVTTIPVGIGPRGVAVSPSGATVYVANQGAGTISAIDAFTNTVVATMPGGSNPLGLAMHPDGSRLYVGHNDTVDSSIGVYDATLQQKVANLGGNSHGYSLVIDPSGAKAYQDRLTSGQIAVLDLATESGHVFNIPTGTSPGLEGMALDPSGTRLYVAKPFSAPQLTIVDTATETAIAGVPLAADGHQVAIHPNGMRAYVAMTGGVAVVDTVTHTVVTTVAVGQPTGIAVDPSGSYVYVIDQGTDKLQVIDTSTNMVVAGIPVGHLPAALGNFVGPATLVASTPPSGTNWALAANGAMAWASSSYGSGFPASGAIDGDRRGSAWGGGTAWNDGTSMAYPDALEVTFNGMKTIDRVVLYTAQDDALHPVDPTDAMKFNFHGIQDFTVEGWTGTNWVLLGRVMGNNLVKRTLTFPPVAIDRIYVNVTQTADGYTYVAEVEAWQSNTATNVALASTGAYAFASSEYGAGFPASAAIDGDRAGHNWGMGSGWNDGTPDAWPDWLEVVLNGMKTIDHVVVYTLQDNATNPVEPTDGMTFSRYGIQDFSLEAWNGTNWVMLGSVTGNNLVKRTVTFPPVTVDRVFLYVTRSLGGYSHVTELEAWSH
jgi:YVTN family beta-propeller protein